MAITEISRSRLGLEAHGIFNTGEVYWNLPPAQLYEHAVRRGEGIIANAGPLVVETGRFTGRSPKDKYIVRESSSEQYVWWGKVNQPFEPAKFENLKQRVAAYFQNRDVFVQDLYAGADPNYRLRVRVLAEGAYHSLFSRILLIEPPAEDLEAFVPEFTIINAPNFKAKPEIDGTKSDVFIILDFAERMMLIGGTSYAGEIKKSVFTILNYLLPRQEIAAMHCSANVGADGDVALFFGLSGTGKTSLSTDPSRPLIGDDEHGWTDRGVFNFEGGCYAKTINLSQEAEPEIYAAVHKFGTVLENVVVDPITRDLDLDDASLTENTRAAYPITHLLNVVPSGQAGHPKNIIFLTADAFGVMPPISKLAVPQALYHFLSGYTSKLAGTERDLGDEPEATFSTCYGAPFLVLHPTEYARLLGDRIVRHDVRCWLVNTGWTGGPFGVGRRIPIAYTRAMIAAALNGQLEDVPYEVEPYFGLSIPQACPGVPTEVLNPRSTWADQAAYDTNARSLAQQFTQNFREFADLVSPEILAAGPKIS